MYEKIKAEPKVSKMESRARLRKLTSGPEYAPMPAFYSHVV